MNWKKNKFDWNILVLPDQCSRTFWAFSRYRYRDTITAMWSCLGIDQGPYYQMYRNSRHKDKDSFTAVLSSGKMVLTLTPGSLSPTHWWSPGGSIELHNVGMTDSRQLLQFSQKRLLLILCFNQLHCHQFSPPFSTTYYTKSSSSYHLYKEKRENTETW